MPTESIHNKPVGAGALDPLNQKSESQKKAADYQGHTYTMPGERKNSLYAHIVSFVTALLRYLYFHLFQNTGKKNEQAVHSKHIIQGNDEVSSSCKEQMEQVQEAVAPLFPQERASSLPLPTTVEEMLGTLREAAKVQSDSMISSKLPLIEQKLNAIQQAAQTDLYLDEAAIRKKYDLDSLFTSMTEEEKNVYQEKLNEIINAAYLQRFSRNQRKILKEEYSERMFLNFLGYEKVYHDKDMINSNFLKMKLEPESLKEGTIQFQQRIQEYALRARLSSLPLTEELQIDKFKAALSLFQEMSRALNKKSKEIGITFPESFPSATCPLAKQSIEKSFGFFKVREIKVVLKGLFDASKIRKGLQEAKISLDAFQQEMREMIPANEEKDPIKTLIANCESEKFKENKNVQNQLNFYTTWGTYLKAEMIQGFSDSNEVLGEGVCLALCFKLLERLQLKPEVNFEQEIIKEGLNIEAIDRFKQAFYQSKVNAQIRQFMENVDSEDASIDILENIKKIILEIPPDKKNEAAGLAKEIPVEWLDKAGFKSINNIFQDIDYHPADGLEQDFNKLASGPKAIKALKASNGWMKLKLRMVGDAHAILMRLDSERNKAWLFDPNIGFFCFEAEGKSFEDARKECLGCLKDSASMLYPSIYKISVAQLLPKSEASKLTDQEQR